MANTPNDRAQLAAFAARLSAVLDDSGVPAKHYGRQGAVAKDLKVTPRAVQKWLDGSSYPQIEKLAALAAHYNTTAEWLLLGTGSRYPSTLQYAPGRAPGRVPLLEWSQIAEWLTAPQAVEALITTWVSDEGLVGPRGYVVRLQDDTMAPTLIEGTLLSVDPDQEVVNGALVIACSPGGSSTCKRVVLDMGRTFLKSLNPAYPMIEVGAQIAFHGVVVRATYVQEFIKR